MSNVTLLGVDIAKNVFQLHGTDKEGNCVLKRKLTRGKFIEFMGMQELCVVAMEACGGANHWYRKFSNMGHTVKLISPQYVKPFVKTNKNDRNDAEAINEAASRANMRFVSPKTVEQEDIQALHRIRTRLIHERTALINQIRGLLLEYGIIIPQGIGQVEKKIPEILEDAENELSNTSRKLFEELKEELIEKNKKVATYDKKMNTVFNTNESCKRIAEIEGIGVITATALVATMGEPTVFKNGRHFAAYLGLVPRQSSSGGKERLLGISKRGNIYLRSLLIHGGRTVVRHADKKDDKRSLWISELKKRRGNNRAAVAVANKNARIVWSLLANSQSYRKVA